MNTEISTDTKLTILTMKFTSKKVLKILYERQRKLLVIAVHDIKTNSKHYIVNICVHVMELEMDRRELILHNEGITLVGCGGERVESIGKTQFTGPFIFQSSPMVMRLRSWSKEQGPYAPLQGIS